MYLILSIFTLLSASVSLAYSIQACVLSKQINAYYAFSRSFSLFVLALFTLVIHSFGFLISMSVLMVLVQFFDGPNLVSNTKQTFTMY